MGFGVHSRISIKIPVEEIIDRVDSQIFCCVWTPPSRMKSIHRAIFSQFRGLFLLGTVLCLVVFNGCNGLSSSNNSNSRPLAKATTPRATAVFSLMESMRKKNKFAHQLLEQNPEYLALDQRDRAYARLLLSIAERRSGQIESVIRSFVHREKKKSKYQNPSVFLTDAALRIGAAQILFMDTPDYAAVRETVESMRMHPKIQASKNQINFANAILRKISRKGAARLADTSILDNVDSWLAEQWIQQYGEKTTEVVIEAAMSQSPVFITVNHCDARHPRTGLSQEDEATERLEQIRNCFAATDEEGLISHPAELLPVGSIRIPDNFRGSLSNWPLYAEGAWWVQDVSATLPALALFNSLIHEKGEIEDMYVVDLCSAPGGKTAQLCSMGFGRVDAVEISAQRTRPLYKNLKRLGMETVCNVVVTDGRKFVPDAAAGPVRGVLVDAPCSATGVGSRRPDVLRKSVDLEELTSIQRELTDHAIDNVLEVGGVLVYATCSLLKQEGEEQIQWLLSGERANTRSTKVETIPFAPGEIPGFDDCIDENGWLRVLPGVLPDSLKYCDGFFIARLRKIA